MKRTVVLIALILGLFLTVPATAQDEQILAGNTESTLSIIAPDDILEWSLMVGSNMDNDSDDDNRVHCFANVPYQVWINCDVDENKSLPLMWEHNGIDYVAEGKHIQVPVDIRVNNNPFQDILEIPAPIEGYVEEPTSNEGRVNYVDIEQTISYVDTPLKLNTYREVLVYTATAHF